MRPKSIVQFERVYIASVLVGIASSGLIARTAATGLQKAGSMASAPTLIAVQCVIGAIFIGIALLASRRASRIARWIVVALCLVTIAAFAVSIPRLPGVGRVAILSVSQAVLVAVAAWLLFRPDSGMWFKGGRA